MDTETITNILLGLVLIALGCSFAYKCFRATVMGKMSYWSGFLPFSVVSPFLTHLPAGPNSLIKDTSGLWVHLIMGPIFLIMSVLMIDAGVDLVGLPGTEMLNLALNGFNPDAPLAITYDKKHTFRFLFLERAGTRLALYFNTAQIPMNDKDRMTNNPETRAEEAARQQQLMVDQEMLRRSQLPQKRERK